MRQRAIAYARPRKWKRKVQMENSVELRGNKKWCEKYGEDLTKPRFIGDKYYIKDGVKYYPPYE